MRVKVKSLLFILSISAASSFASECPYVERMADAIYQAEGGNKTEFPYGVKSIKVSSEKEARRVTINSIRNNWKRWEKAGKPGNFVDFMADRWCPKSADPIGNKNWKKNVKILLFK